MLLCKNRRLFTVAGDKFVRPFSNSDVLTPIPMGIPWDLWDPSLPHSHAHLYYGGAEIDTGGVRLISSTIAKSYVRAIYLAF